MTSFIDGGWHSSQEALSDKNGRIRHQHFLSPTSVTNIDQTDKCWNRDKCFFYVNFVAKRKIRFNKILQGIQWLTRDPKIISILYHSNLGSTLLPDHPYLRICSAYRWFSWFVHDMESRKEMWYRFRVKLSEIIFSNPKNRISKAV